MTSWVPIISGITSDQLSFSWDYSHWEGWYRKIKYVFRITKMNSVNEHWCLLSSVPSVLVVVEACSCVQSTASLAESRCNCLGPLSGRTLASLRPSRQVDQMQFLVHLLKLSRLQSSSVALLTEILSTEFVFQVISHLDSPQTLL